MISTNSMIEGQDFKRVKEDSIESSQLLIPSDITKKYFLDYSEHEIDIFLSLLLTRFVEEENVEMVKLILQYPHTDNILVYSNDEGMTPLFAALLLNDSAAADQIMHMFSDYIQQHQIVEKLELNNNEQDMLFTIAATPSIEYVTEREYFNIITEKYLGFLYSAESLGVVSDQFT